MRYNYQARTIEGELRVGVVEASSREAALSLLQKMGLYVTYLEVESVPIYTQKISFLRRITSKDIVLFTRQLSIMVGGELPLVEALGTLANQTSNPDLREIAFKLTKDVEGGSTLSEALSRHPKVFSVFFVAMVKAGETVGKLASTLSYLADHLERQHNLKSKIQGALIYPGFVLFVALAVCFLIAFFIVPQLEGIISEAGIQFPFITRLIIKIALFLRKHAILLFLLFILFCFLLSRYYRTKEGKYFIDSLLIKLPVIGNILKNLYIAQFAEILFTLLVGGVAIAKALQLTGETIANKIYKEAIFSTMESVKKGTLISDALFQFPQIFPLVVVQMISAGEKTGTLDTTLKNMANFYQKEAERTIESALTLLEPLLILFLGLIVGGIVLSIIIPLYRVITIGAGL
jgi:type IV pilus assembly protein PilC